MELSKGLEFLQGLSDKDFIETYFSCIDKDRKEVPFLFNKVQSALEASWSNFNIVLKYRKPGVSLQVQSKFLSRILRKKNRNAVVLSFDKESTQRQLERTNWTMNHLPLQFTPERESKQEFYIKETNSKLFMGVAGSKAFGRGDDITDLHISEYAFFENPNILTGIMEALTNDAFVVIESTANGPLNEYAKLYRKGKEGRSKWKSHFFPWWIDTTLTLPVPANFVHTEEEIEMKRRFPLMTDGQIQWRRQKLLDMLEPDLFPQEFPADDTEAFLVLGSCIFNAKALKAYDSQVREPNYVGELYQIA